MNNISYDASRNTKPLSTFFTEEEKKRTWSPETKTVYCEQCGCTTWHTKGLCEECEYIR